MQQPSVLERVAQNLRNVLMFYRTALFFGETAEVHQAARIDADQQLGLGRPQVL
jgi:hypothetical protein